MRTGVAFIIGTFYYGGAERDLLELARRLDRRRYELHVLYLSREGEMYHEVEATGATMQPLGIENLVSFAGMRAVREARAYLSRRHVRILQGFGTYGSFYAAVIARGMADLRVVSYEFTPVRPAGLKARLFQPWYYTRADCIVGNSDAVLAAVGGRRGVRGKPLVRIYNGIDATRYSDNGVTTAPPAGVPPGVPVVGSIGRLTPVKGHEYLIRSWPRVLERFPSARLLLIGPSTPKDRSRIEAAIRDAGCGPAVSLLGPRGDVPQILTRLDVVALPSLTEGFSNVLIEAGASARTVVATRVGGNPEAIEEGVTGLLVPPRDPAALGAAIVELLGDPDRRRRMGEAARRRVNALYTVEKMVEGFDRLYTSLIEARRIER